MYNRDQVRHKDSLTSQEDADINKIKDNFELLDNIERRLKGYLGNREEAKGGAGGYRLSSDTDGYGQVLSIGILSPVESRAGGPEQMQYASPPTKDRTHGTGNSFGAIDLKAPDYSFKKASKETLKAYQTATFQTDERPQEDSNHSRQFTSQTALQDKIKAIDDKISRFKQENITFGDNKTSSPSHNHISIQNQLKPESKSIKRSSTLEKAIQDQISALQTSFAHTDYQTSQSSKNDIKPRYQMQ